MGKRLAFRTNQQPAAFVTRDHTILFSNIRLLKALSKFNHDVIGRRIGDVLGCKNAASLGQCGDTVGCIRCGIRKSIELTRTTGERVSGIPTDFQHKSGARGKLRITTDKVREAVLLIITDLPAVLSGWGNGSVPHDLDKG